MQAEYRLPLSDASGEVVAVGAGVTRFKVGDAVLPTFLQGWPSGLPIPERRADWTRTDMLHEYVVVPADAFKLINRGGHFGKIVLSVG